MSALEDARMGMETLSARVRSVPSTADFGLCLLLMSQVASCTLRLIDLTCVLVRLRRT